MISSIPSPSGVSVKNPIPAAQYQLPGVQSVSSTRFAANPVSSAETETLRKRDIAKELLKHMNDPHTGKALKALSCQYGPDMLLAVMLSVPVLGWGAALVSLPFTMWMGHQGEKMVEAHMKEIPDKNPFHHVYNIQSDWHNPKQNNNLANRLVSHYNKLVDSLFPVENNNTQKLRQSLKITPDLHKSRAFQMLNRLINARQAYWKAWYVSYPLKPLDWLSRGMSKLLPKSLSLLPQIPKFSLIGLFFLLKTKPKSLP
jgi:hypothetical protein